MAPDAQAALAALRKTVEAKDKATLAGLLAKNFVALGCTSDPLKPCAPGKARAIASGIRDPLERLRLALCCEGKTDPSSAPATRDESLWGLLASILQTGTPGGNPDIADSVCLPAIPTFDRKQAADFVKRAAIEPENLRLAASAFDARERPDKDAPIRKHFEAGAIVPFAGQLTEAVPDGWTALALQQGGMGFTDALAFEELTPQSVCLRREANRWTFAVLILRVG